MTSRISVTKPQAVIAVATNLRFFTTATTIRYKTASGNRCCNKRVAEMKAEHEKVTKPQAVIAVATRISTPAQRVYEGGYKTASGNRCCN